MEKYFIYILKCPASHDAMYVGVTTNLNKYGKKAAKWISKLEFYELKPIFEVVEVCEEKQESINKLKVLIRKLKAENITLLNCTYNKDRQRRKKQKENNNKNIELMLNKIKLKNLIKKYQ
jgi:predicted GIY-YIG superfamily endonuclease